MIDLKEFALKFAANAEVIRSLAGSITHEQARWQPAPGKWSVLMVLCHLVDEERDDFRRRVDLTLHNPGEQWPAIDPEGWARDRGYNDRDPDRVLAEFLTERARSREWIAGLENPQWDNVYRHPMGDLRAGDVMLSWLAHDYLHIRQIIRLLFEDITERHPDYITRYAGEW